MVFGKVVSGLEVLRRVHPPNLPGVSDSEAVSQYALHGNSWITARDPKVS